MPDAIVIPGRLFGPGAPLPMYTGEAAQRRGATVHRHSWSEEAPQSSAADLERWVRGQVTAILDALTGRPLMVGKSLGTFAAGLAAERSLPAVWLTPLLTVPEVVGALERARAPFLLVGGTADTVWDSAVAHRLTPHVFEVDGADHGMYVQGPLTESIAVLAGVVTATERFLDAIAWPEGARTAP